MSVTAQQHLLYTRFYTVSERLAPLLAELERRAAVHPEELSSLLAECHAAYFAARKGLLVNRLTEEIKGLDPTRTELVELVNLSVSCTLSANRLYCHADKGRLQLSQAAMHRRVRPVSRVLQLGRARAVVRFARALVFTIPDRVASHYLENLCDYLYDDLRPRILHEPRLTALCEVCTVLQALMVLDVPALPEDDSDADADEDAGDVLKLDFTDRRTGTRGLRALQVSHLLQMVLQDAQTRLFFKAQSVIQSDIRYYVSKAEDIAYPEKLLSECRNWCARRCGLLTGDVWQRHGSP